MNQPEKIKFTMVLLVTKSALLFMASFFLAGCGNLNLKIKQPALFTGNQTHHGSLSVKVTDARQTTGRIGVWRGGFGNHLGDIILADDLDVAFTSIFTKALESNGYSVVPSTNAQVNVKITMFVTDTTGHGKFARHKTLVQLCDERGDIRWEKNLLGEAAGMQNGATTSMEHCMNLALERLVHQAAEEFSSELFRQQVRKLNQNQQ